MAKTKRKFERMLTPIGVAAWPKLNSPDTTYDDDGVYSVKLRFNENDPQFQKFLAELEQRYEDNLKQQLDTLKAKGTPKQVKAFKAGDKSWRKVEDDDGNPTGEMEINFKMKAIIRKKDSDEFWEQRPAIFDSKGVELKPVPRIGGGSKLRINFEINPFYTAKVGATLSLRMRAVQLIELVEFSHGDAKSYGFDEQEGYEFEAPAEGAGNDSTGDGDDADDSDSTEAGDDEDF